MSEFGWNYIGKGMGVARRVVLTEKRAKGNAVQINHLGKIIKRLPVNMIPTRSIMSERASRDDSEGSASLSVAISSQHPTQ